MPFKSVSVASSGNNTLVTGVAGHVYQVVSYVLVAAGAVNVKWISGTTDISGVMNFAANGGASATGGGREAPLMETIAGDSLILNLSGAVQVSGHMTYNDILR
jgi:hypothetical protein